MPEIALRAIAIQVAGRREPCQTILVYAGAYQLTLSTVLTGRGVELHSSFLGHPAAELAIAGHLLLAPHQAPRAWGAEHDARELPVRDARRRCLLDHLAVLSDELPWLLTAAVHIDVEDAALDELDRT